MAKSGPAVVKVWYDNSGGTPVDITQYVLSINDIEIESMTEEKHPLGTAWDESLPIGVAKMNDIEISGLFDDAATTGPDALLAGRAPEAPTAGTRTLKIEWNASKSTAVETYLMSYARAADRNGLTKYKVKLKPSGGVTEV